MRQKALLCVFLCLAASVAAFADIDGDTTAGAVASPLGEASGELTFMNAKGGKGTQGTSGGVSV